MKRRITFQIIIMMTVLFFSSCKREESVNIDQNRIYSNYEYVYDANTNKSSMTATFRLDNSSGQKIELSYPSRVSFNGEGLSWKNAMGHYALNQYGTMSSGSFTYNDLDDQQFVNAVESLGSIEIPFGLNAISRSGNFFLPWTGAALQPGETIRVTISGGSQSASRTWNITASGSTHIVLDQFKLDDLEVGSANIQIERERSNSLTESNLSGGRLSASYKSRKISINMTN